MLIQHRIVLMIDIPRIRWFHVWPLSDQIWNLRIGSGDAIATVAGNLSHSLSHAHCHAHCHCRFQAADEGALTSTLKMMPHAVCVADPEAFEQLCQALCVFAFE